MQRHIADTEHRSEHTRAMSASRADTAACKAACLAGPMRPSGGPCARSLIQRRATLTSRDDAGLRGEVVAAVSRGDSARKMLRSQTTASRGRMLHDAFPPPCSASAHSLACALELL